MNHADRPGPVRPSYAGARDEYRRAGDEPVDLTRAEQEGLDVRMDDLDTDELVEAAMVAVATGRARYKNKVDYAPTREGPGSHNYNVLRWAR